MVNFSDGVALGALCLSIYSTFQSYKAGKLQDQVIVLQKELTEFRLEKEKREKALYEKYTFGANVVKLGKGNYRLRISNKGTVRAENIEIFPDENLASTIINDIFPLEFLDPMKSVDLHFILSLNSENKYKLRIQWSEMGTEEIREQDFLLTV